MRDKLKLFTKKILVRLFKLLGLSSLFSFLGCSSIFPFLFGGDNPYVCMYGVPDNIIEIEGTVYGDIDGDGKEEPVPNIKVSKDSSENEVYTDSNGSFYYSSLKIEDSITLTFSDVDGNENGAFNNTSNTYDLTKAHYQTKDIHLTKKDYE